MSDATAEPLLVHTVAELREAVAAARRHGARVGFVPTMGALHAGHISLVRAARQDCGFTVVSIYVNPSQFGPREDLAAYPRTLPADMELLRHERASLVFAPSDAEMYPEGYATWVDVEAEAGPLEGDCRPGHFRGVATIVLKLFNAVAPDVAYFGQKDYQQTLVVRRMAADLNLPLSVVVCPTVRESDGLAMSSRNAYLSSSERQRALVLWRSLERAQELLSAGTCDAAAIVRAMKAIVDEAQPAAIDYIALVDPQTLQPVARLDRPTLAALAVRIGTTRLIDNQLLQPPAAGEALTDPKP